MRTTIEEAILSLKLDKNCKILDVACGIGNIGETLRNNGYFNVDGLDPIQGYLEVAIENKIYKRTFKDCIDPRKPTSVPDSEYDIVVCGAGFFEGLIPFKGLAELLRVAKKGGLVIWSIAETEEESEHDKVVEDMIQNQEWIMVERRQFSKLAFTDSGAAYLSGYPSAGIETAGSIFIMKKK